ncbi:MAG: PepSY domain-containing protein, partial [Spirochaetia bacterium]|nr:PepSY domain-containing protein [Spirochaetia bacterium]
RFEKYLDQVPSVVPHWESIQIRLPAREDGPLVLAIQEKGKNRFQRSNLSLNAKSGAVEKWVPYEGLSKGRKLRSFMRGLHTGEWFGWPGQLVAALATFAATMLVWTGLSLAIRRFGGWIFKRS